MTWIKKKNYKLNVAINFQFLFLDEELMNRSRSKWRKYQEGRTQVQKCPVGEGREEGVGVEFSLCWTAAVTSKLRNSQPPSWKVEKSYLSLCFLEQCTFCFTSRGFILDLNKYLILGSPQLFFTWTTPMAFVPAFFIKVVFRTNLLSVDGREGKESRSREGKVEKEKSYEFEWIRAT